MALDFPVPRLPSRIQLRAVDSWKSKPFSVGTYRWVIFPRRLNSKAYAASHALVTVFLSGSKYGGLSKPLDQSEEFLSKPGVRTVGIYANPLCRHMFFLLVVL